MRVWNRTFAALLLALWAGLAGAHKASDAYLRLERSGAAAIALRWDIALRDLDALLALDGDDDGAITWREVGAKRAEIERYAASRLHIAGCALRPAADAAGAPLERRVDGTYLVLRLAGDCPRLASAQDLALGYALFAELDPTHRGLLRTERGDGRVHVASLVPGAAATHIDIGAAPPVAALALPGSASPAPMPMPAAVAPPVAAAAETQLLLDGLRHILGGADHLLFLACLLLPAVLRRAPDGRWRPVERWQDALRPMLWTVTMFTIAHSITLGLAAARLVSVSPRVIEPAIALTIALAAWDNLRPLFGARRHGFTFAFGLIHGFGFAEVLAELELPPAEFMSALLRFNIGVELGQLLVVLPLLTLLLALRGRRVYARALVPTGSALALAAAGGWFVERVFDLGFMPI